MDSQQSAVVVDSEADLGLRALDPERYLLQHLRHGLRLDGRECGATRPLSLRRGVLNAQPSAMVRLGDTVVFAAVRLLVGTPSVNHPDQGDVIFDCSILSERIDNRSKTRTETDVEAVLAKLMRRYRLCKSLLHVYR